MKKFFTRWALPAAALVTLSSVLFLAGACKSAGPAVLTVVKGGQTKTLTMTDLKALSAVSGSTGDITSSGTIEGPFEYKGVPLTDVLKAVGGITSDEAIRISAKDGYSMTMSYKQAAEGGEFPTYDRATGKEVTPSGALTVFLAYEKDGKAIDQTVGPLRLGIMAPGQVTDGHWWVKWAQKIEVISAQQPWSMSLQGLMTQVVDKSTFESCAASNCHGTKYTDAQGHVWSGVALWDLVGNVDADKQMSFNDALADQGYQVHVADANGDMVSFTSQEVKRNNNIIVANQVDGQPLSTKDWPLTLVGSAVDQQHQLGMISKVKLVFPSTPTPAPGASK